ncbi:hypothetical protein ACRRTK_009097 [Alexandromys fortis]
MCERAARLCRAGAHRLLREPPPQGRALGGLLRWVGARMGEPRAPLVPDIPVADPDPGPGPAAPHGGTAVILDIFRRADKNDDGKLSLEEFQLFFADGVLSEKELEDLFHTIDSDNTNHVDTKELCDYFVDHMGDYEDVLASLETLNHSVLKAMGYTKKRTEGPFLALHPDVAESAPHYHFTLLHPHPLLIHTVMLALHCRGLLLPANILRPCESRSSGVYEGGSNVDQFVTRFLLKETANQIQSLLSSVESAVEAIDEQTSQIRQEHCKPSHGITKSHYGGPSPPYIANHKLAAPEPGRSLPMATGEPKEEGLEGQISRLAELIGRLESKHLQLVRQEMAVCPEQLSEFLDSLRQYLRGTAGERNCFHVAAVRMADGLTFVIYEFWETEEEWKRHLQSPVCKAFRHVKVDTLSQPEALSQISVPAAWCTSGRD